MIRVDPPLAGLVLFGAWFALRLWWWWRCATYRKQPIPTWLWLETMERGRWRCANRWCRSTSDLQADHKWPEWWFGRMTPGNLQVLCKACNRRKGARVKLPGLPWWAFWIILGRTRARGR